MQVSMTQSLVEGRHSYDLVGIGSLHATPPARFDRIASAADERRYTLTHRLLQGSELHPVALDDAGRIVGRMDSSRWPARSNQLDWQGTRFRFQSRGRTDPIFRLETMDRQPMATFTPFSSVLDLAQPVDPGLLLFCIWFTMVATRIREFGALDVPIHMLQHRTDFEVPGIGRLTRVTYGDDGDAVTHDERRYRMPVDSHGLCALDAHGLTVGRFYDSGFSSRHDFIRWQGWQFVVSYNGNMTILHTSDGRPLTTVRGTWSDSPTPGFVNFHESVDAGLALYFLRLVLDRAYAPRPQG